MSSRLPRIFQRIVYRHRRSISLVYNQSRDFFNKAKAVCLKPATIHMHSFNSVTFQAANRFSNENTNPTLPTVSKNEMSTLSKSEKHCIEFGTFNHPKIDLNVFKANLKQFWNFVPKTNGKMNKDYITTIEFEHESGCPQYPIIIVNQLHYENLSNNVQEVIDGMIHTIPSNDQLNPSKSENFLVSGRIWEPVTNEQFDLVRKESKFAASLSVSGIFPKKPFSEMMEPSKVIPSSKVNAVQAGIDLEHVIPSTSLQPTAMSTFREMLACSVAN